MHSVVCTFFNAIYTVNFRTNHMLIRVENDVSFSVFYPSTEPVTVKWMSFFVIFIRSLLKNEYFKSLLKKHYFSQILFIHFDKNGRL